MWLLSKHGSTRGHPSAGWLDHIVFCARSDCSPTLALREDVHPLGHRLNTSSDSAISPSALNHYHRHRSLQKATLKEKATESFLVINYVDRPRPHRPGCHLALLRMNESSWLANDDNWKWSSYHINYVLCAYVRIVEGITLLYPQCRPDTQPHGLFF